MKTDNELLELIDLHLAYSLGNLWDTLSPEERRRVFNQLINEYISVNY